MLAQPDAYNEYRRYLRRGGQDYDVRHQVMYLSPIMLISGRPNSILEVGFGIGFGLRNMLEGNAIGTYVGYEPCRESYDFVASQFTAHPKITLINEPFTGTAHSYDYAFCIDVIQEIKSEDLRISLLNEISLATFKVLFLSTPDRTRDDSGVYTEHEMVKRLYRAGFDNVSVFPEQRSNLYIAS